MTNDLKIKRFMHNKYRNYAGTKQFASNEEREAHFKRFNWQQHFQYFEEIDNQEQIELFKRIPFFPTELPVFRLKIDTLRSLVCTSQRFIYLQNDDIEDLYYHTFVGHGGFIKSQDNVKQEGLILPFEFCLEHAESRIWEIPSGNIGFAFWNITKSFGIIAKWLKSSK
jgi:hypothetical protein